MKKLLYLLLFIPTMLLSQNCVRVDVVYSTAKFRELNDKKICFGVKQIAEDLLSEKYCLSNTGEAIKIEVYYFGMPRTEFRIAGYGSIDQSTQVGVRLYYKDAQYESTGESSVEVKAVVLELVEGALPFNQTNVAIAIKKALQLCIQKLP